ncbi:MAG: hypothetical protein K2X77_26540 [Candidatus Obscuribacterales bacterium]|jgi:hypothetical protein|nr:hypothetical protein [Candidatus Obscuribacterales bacterium]
MGLSLHLTSIRDGTVIHTVRFLASEKATGRMSVSFGRHIPEASIFFDNGSISGAEFGDLHGDGVLDLLICQEYSAKEINYQIARVKKKTVEHCQVSHTDLAQVNMDVEKCEVRSQFYGSLQVQFANLELVDSLLQVIAEFEKHRSQLESIKSIQPLRKAPLTQCSLLRRALDAKELSYKPPLVLLKTIRNYCRQIMQDLPAKEIRNFRGYLRSLLFHQKAEHISLERMYALMSALESIAYRQGSESGDLMRKRLQDYADGNLTIHPTNDDDDDDDDWFS